VESQVKVDGSHLGKDGLSVTGKAKRWWMVCIRKDLVRG
jgi:hypothetical protein